MQDRNSALHVNVLDFFENLLTSIMARIVEDNSTSVQDNSKKKKNQLSLLKAKSVINEDASETLLIQGFDIIFKEFQRFIKITSDHVSGIDWATYVK